jgi:hypothetical protein
VSKTALYEEEELRDCVTFREYVNTKGEVNITPAKMTPFVFLVKPTGMIQPVGQICYIIRPLAC